ncbi:hypothetical protein ACFLTH_17470, partial [Bacteroidota bacterium]
MRQLIILLCFLFSHLLHAQSTNDFMSDTLFAVWGKSNYSGKNDCNAMTRIKSDGRNIHIIVRVGDDKLVLNEDPIHSDHVELWFALPGILDQYVDYETLESNKFIISDSFLYLINGKPDLPKFKSFINDPLINARDAGIDSFYYSQMDENQGIGSDWLKESIDSYLSDARSSKLQVNNFPFGVVHFGLLPKVNKAVQYDTELYLPLEKFAGIKLDDLAGYIELSSRIDNKGYSFRIKIKADALGFTSKHGIGGLKFLLDVVDVDDKGKQETLLSTSRKRMWGNPNTFNEINFGEHINFDINSSIKSLGRKKSYSDPYNNVINNISNYFVKTISGWTPVEIEKIRFYEYNQPEVYLMESISKFE